MGRLIFISLFIFQAAKLFSIYPEIEVTDPYEDTYFNQLMMEIDENRRRIKTGEKTLPLLFFLYKTKEDENVFTLSSRLNLPYDTLSTLNNVDNALYFPREEYILIPSSPGIFLKKEIENNKNHSIININVNERKESFYFYPEGSFSNKERTAFLVSPFGPPLLKMRSTSLFGYRENPFTGKTELHRGLDLEAPEGTRVLASEGGWIREASYDRLFGYYIVIVHKNGFSTCYMHLKEILTEKNMVIQKGEVIALSGNSGRSTGPHLHFEIHEKNQPVDPEKFLGKEILSKY